VSYDEKLAARCRKLLAAENGVREVKMFGGLCFMLHGNMIGGVLNDHLVLRLGVSAAYERALRSPHVRPMDFTGRIVPGMLYVDAPGLSGPGLRTWLGKGVAFGKSLPKKKKAARTRTARRRATPKKAGRGAR
jgi:hypothetical protein